ncbi:MAG: potassium channel family protein [Burkholderiales bacterium]
MDPRAMRRSFLAHFWAALRVVWPILSALLVVMVGLGVVVGRIEHWPLRDSLYFTFVSGLTIGYGDLVPKTLLARALAVAIGITGVLLSGLIAAVGVQALLAAAREGSER